MDDSRPRSRRFTADARYLVFPRARDHAGDRAGAGRDHLRVATAAGTWFSVHGAALAANDPDFYSYLDLSLLQGRELTVAIAGPHAAGIELVRVSDRIPGPHPSYAEPGRPQVHFSPLRGWLNDPSGMFYLDGRWHLYYANTRFANRMAGPDNAWAHAVSDDLLHWEELPLLLAPERGRHSFWTGGAAVDLANATGLASAQRPAVVFAANNGSDAPNAFTQCTFVSVDGGLTCSSDPPMMYHPLPPQADRRGGGTRDPMILWWEPERKWVMVVYNRPPGGEHSFHFFASRDLRSWHETGVLPGMYECPNLFRLPVDGDPHRQRWVVWGSATEYLVGDFDGDRFIPDTGERLRTHHGAFSASQVFANAPAGRIVQIGWAHCCNYAHEFCQMASFPAAARLAHHRRRRTPVRTVHPRAAPPAARWLGESGRDRRRGRRLRRRGQLPAAGGAAGGDRDARRHAGGQRQRAGTHLARRERRSAAAGEARVGSPAGSRRRKNLAAPPARHAVGGSGGERRRLLRDSGARPPAPGAGRTAPDRGPRR